MTTKNSYLATFYLIVFSVSCVFAQSTKKDDISQMASAFTVVPSVNTEAQKRGEVLRLLQNGNNLSNEDQTTVTNYLQRYELARWTDPQNAANFALYHQELKDLVGSVSDPQGKEFLLSRLTALLYGYAMKTDLYPACRYNAVLALGELDSGQTDGRPIPYLPALARLLAVYNNKGDGKDTANEAIRLGALLGIRRHVILGITNVKARDEEVPKLLMSIAADTPYLKDPAAEEVDTSVSDRKRVQSIVVSVEANAKNISEKYRTVQQHDWFRLRAIETMGHMFYTSPDTQLKIIDTLLKLIDNDAELPSIQYAAAYSLSNYTPVIANTPGLLKSTTEALLKLGLTVQKDGMQTMFAESSTQTTVGSLSTGGGSYGDSSGMTSSSTSSSSGGGANMSQVQADQINNSLIQIKDGFSSIKACLAGANFSTGGLINSESVKNTQYHEILVGLNKTISDCVKFLDEGDPEAKKQTPIAGMSSDPYSSSPSSGRTGTPTVTVKNAPKVTMKEVEDRLRIVRNDIIALQNQLNSPLTGMAAAR